MATAYTVKINSKLPAKNYYFKLLAVCGVHDMSLITQCMLIAPSPPPSEDLLTVP